MQELNQSLTHLHSNLSKVREESQQLESELQAIRSEVMTERAEKERQGKTLGAMKSRDEVDLKELQDAIGWKIEGSGRMSSLIRNRDGADGVEDQLLMRFTLIDPANPERGFMIVIDISKQDYAGRSPMRGRGRC
jgi:kinetochore protein Spc25